MTFEVWLPAAAGAVAAAGVLWRKIVRPLTRGGRELLGLLRELLEVLEHWPDFSRLVTEHTAEFERVHIRIGEVSGTFDIALQAVRRDVNELWRRYRRDQGETEPQTRGETPRE